MQRLAHSGEKRQLEEKWRFAAIGHAGEQKQDCPSPSVHLNERCPTLQAHLSTSEPIEARWGQIILYKIWTGKRANFRNFGPPDCSLYQAQRSLRSFL